MPQFMIAYHGGKQPSSQEEGMAQMNKWKAWIDGLGDKIVNPGTPLMNTHKISKSETQKEDHPELMKGFAVIHADNIEEAIKVAKTDPFLEMDGDIRISQMMEMK